MKKNKFSLTKLLVIIDVLAIIMLIILILVKYLNKDEKNFKDFTYDIPSDINYSVSGDTILLSGNDWNAEAEILLDKDDYLFNNPDDVYQTIRNHNYDIDLPITTSINDVDFVIYNIRKNQGVLCYFRFNQDYLYEVRLYNNSTLSNDTLLGTISSILINGTYNGGKNSDDKYFSLENIH